MLDSKRKVCAAGIAALLVAMPGEGAAQPAPSAQAEYEPMCVYDSLPAPADGMEFDAARVAAIRSECRQRFGWTEAQADQGVAVARLTAEAMTAIREAVNAGVDPGLLESVYKTFSSSDAASLGTSGTASSRRARGIGGQLSRRLAERGLRGEAAAKAARAITLHMIAINAVTEFSVEVGTDLSE